MLNQIRVEPFSEKTFPGIREMKPCLMVRHGYFVFNKEI